MEKIDITKIEVLESGELAIYPSISSSDYQYVYRAAASVYWDNSHKRFQHNFDGYDSKSLSHYWWYKQIVSVLRTDMGLDLVINDHTQWINISEDQKHQIITTE